MDNSKTMSLLVTLDFHAGWDPDVLEYIVSHQPGIDVEKAIEDTICCFLQTDEGKEVAQGENGHFNYGDAVVYVPNEVWQKFGILSIAPSSLPRISVNHNRNFWKEAEEAGNPR